MSNTQPDEAGRNQPLPEPIGEDGVVQRKDAPREPGEGEDSEIEEIDGGLAETGGGDPSTRKVV